jgi:GDP-L-fucose synthase
LVNLIKDVFGFDGEIIFDSTKLDGTMRKLMDSSRLNGLG